MDIFCAWAGRACWSASLEPPRSSPERTDKIPACGWLEVLHNGVGRVRFDAAGGGTIVKGDISFVARSHPGVYPVAAKMGSADVTPHFIVQRTTSANAVGEVKVGAIVAEQWGNAVRDQRGLTQANYFFFVGFGSIDGHVRRIRESLPSLRTWYASSRSNMSLNHLFEGYHGLVTPKTPISYSGELRRMAPVSDDEADMLVAEVGRLLGGRSVYSAGAGKVRAQVSVTGGVLKGGSRVPGGYVPPTFDDYPHLEALRARLSMDTRVGLDICLVNSYLTSDANINWHIDSTDNSGVTVASVSLGATRSFYTRNAGDVRKYTLGHKDVVVFDARCEHRVPAGTVAQHPSIGHHRINLTFRHLLL